VPHHYHDHQGRGGYGDGPRIPLSALDPVLRETTSKVIGCSIEVHRHLGPGFEAKVYEAALKHELENGGIKFECPFNLALQYKGRPLGDVPGGMRIERGCLIWLSAQPGRPDPYDRTCMKALLRAAALDLGLMINFAERRLKDGLVRIVNTDRVRPSQDRDGPLPGDGPEGPDATIDDFEVGR
jgi:GxxExxY protein